MINHMSPTSKTIHGVLEAYWEQGMEGRIEYMFYPDDPQERPKGSLPIPLHDGQYLKIYQPDGQTLWEGRLQFVSRHKWMFSEKHELPNEIWNDAKQKGIPYKKWIAWFWQKPPLRAELTLAA